MVPFINRKDDREMIYLTQYLKQISHVSDVRPKLSEKFMLTKLRKHEVLEKIDGVIEQGIEEVGDDFFLPESKPQISRETRAECSLDETCIEGVGYENINTLKRSMPKPRPSNKSLFDISNLNRYEAKLELAIPEEEEYDIIETVEYEEY